MCCLFDLTCSSHKSPAAAFGWIRPKPGVRLSLARCALSLRGSIPNVTPVSKVTRLFKNNCRGCGGVSVLLSHPVRIRCKSAPSSALHAATSWKKKKSRIRREKYALFWKCAPSDREREPQSIPIQAVTLANAPTQQMTAHHVTIPIV